MTTHLTTESATDARSGTSPFSVLRGRNFRLLWLGENISLVGDQFYLIALPWLVLQLTGDGLAMGTVPALGGIPRALFMLLGGALTDRFSPRPLMLWSNIFRLILVGAMTVLVLTGTIQLWMIYLFSLLFGLADAFFFPAQSAIVPQLVEGEQLQAANALVQGTAQLSLFVGPVLAGVLIAVLDSGQSVEGGTPGLQGIGLALAFDALTFLVSAVTLWFIRLKPAAKTASGTASTSVLRSIQEGLAYVWRDASLRIFFILVAAINFLINGPFLVGIPVLADQRLPEGAAAFGVLMSAFGGGSLLGILVAGVLPKPAPARLGAILLVVTSALGIGLAGLGLSSSTAVAAVISLLMGITNGYVVILFMTWLQSRTPQDMLGRMMSLLMFASLGLNPVSMALSGALAEWNNTVLFVGAGLLMSVVVLLAALNPTARRMGVIDSPA